MTSFNFFYHLSKTESTKTPIIIFWEQSQLYHCRQHLIWQYYWRLKQWNIIWNVVCTDVQKGLVTCFHKRTGHLECLEFSRWLADLWGQAASQTRLTQKDFKMSLAALTARGAEIWGVKDERYSVKKDPIKCHKMIYLYGEPSVRTTVSATSVGSAYINFLYGRWMFTQKSTKKKPLMNMSTKHCHIIALFIHFWNIYIYNMHHMYISF